MNNLSREKLLTRWLNLHDLEYEFKSGRIDELGKILHEGWLLKQTISDKISSNEINDCTLKLKSGAAGGKLLGAGAGGFILFYVPSENTEKFNNQFKLLKEYDFNLDYSGTQIIYNNEK